MSAPKEVMPDAYGELARVFELLEQHYRDMQDIEFTVERGHLWMLQTRSGKRTAKAALKMAVDMVHEGLIDEKTAILRVDPMALDQLLHPTLDPEAVRDILADRARRLIGEEAAHLQRLALSAQHPRGADEQPVQLLRGPQGCAGRDH